MFLLVQHYIYNIQTGAVVITTKVNSTWTGSYEIYLGDGNDGRVWAKFKSALSAKKCATITFPNTDDVPLHVRCNAGGGRYRIYRGEPESDSYTVLNFDKDNNLSNLVADITIGSWTNKTKILIQPGQEKSNMLPLLLFAVIYLVRQTRE